jgi:D-beta-D-heptose 7-phosphate kinase/D-beta-D-heptose 1-phosphate adenosyltransferase
MSETTEVLAALDQLGTPELVVVGDVMLDRYRLGTVQRVNPEAPTLVLEVRHEEARPGGAAAVAVLAQALGARVSLLGVMGRDEAGQHLGDLLDEAGIETAGVLADPQRVTTVKERLGVEGGRDFHPLLRVDRESCLPLDRAWEERLVTLAQQRLRWGGALLVADHGKGTCTPGLLARLAQVAAQQEIAILVDPARGADWSKYRLASALVPNRHEAAGQTGQAITTAEEGLAAARLLVQRHGVEVVLVKLDRDGLALAEHAQAGCLIRSRAQAVRDVTGAGDALLATLGLGRAAGLSWHTAAKLANAAAGLEVSRRGVVPLSRDELRQHLLGTPGQGKRVSLSTLEALAAGYRRAGQTLVLTNGCFDLLHAGHLAFLEEANQQGDVLAVAVNSDSSVRRLKGSDRPVIGQEQRAALLAGLACVRHVVLFDEDTPHELVRRVRPDVLVKGGDYTRGGVVAREVVEAYGGRIHVTRKLGEVSTSGIVAAVRGLGLWAVD